MTNQNPNSSTITKKNYALVISLQKLSVILANECINKALADEQLAKDQRKNDKTSKRPNNAYTRKISMKSQNKAEQAIPLAAESCYSKRINDENKTLPLNTSSLDHNKAKDL